MNRSRLFALLLLASFGCMPGPADTTSATNEIVPEEPGAPVTTEVVVSVDAGEDAGAADVGEGNADAGCGVEPCGVDPCAVPEPPAQSTFGATLAGSTEMRTYAECATTATFDIVRNEMTMTEPTWDFPGARRENGVARPTPTAGGRMHYEASKSDRYLVHEAWSYTVAGGWVRDGLTGQRTIEERTAPGGSTVVHENPAIPGVQALSTITYAGSFADDRIFAVTLAGEALEARSVFANGTRRDVFPDAETEHNATYSASLSWSTGPDGFKPSGQSSNVGTAVSPNRTETWTAVSTLTGGVEHLSDASTYDAVIWFPVPGGFSNFQDRREGWEDNCATPETCTWREDSRAISYESFTGAPPWKLRRQATIMSETASNFMRTTLYDTNELVRSVDAAKDTGLASASALSMGWTPNIGGGVDLTTATFDGMSNLSCLSVLDWISTMSGHESALCIYAAPEHYHSTGCIEPGP